MEGLYLPGQGGSFPTPRVDFDPHTGVLTIAGESHPEDATAFYAPLHLWLDALLAGPPRTVVLELRLTFFTASTRAELLALLRRLHAAAAAGSGVRASWQIDPEDEDMVDTAADLETESRLPIRIVRSSLPPPDADASALAELGVGT